MSLQVEKLEHNMAKLTIEVSAEEVEKALQAAACSAFSTSSAETSIVSFAILCSNFSTCKLIFFLLVYKQILYLSNELIS